MYQAVKQSYFGDKDEPEIRLVIIRHGERVDSKYGPYWYYNPTALNDMFAWPSTRQNPNDYILDPPLTIGGAYNASKVGQILTDSNNLTFELCFSSPALRCVQTARCVLQGSSKDRQQTIPIYICPNLYECYGWMGGPRQNPNFITANEWQKNGLQCLTMENAKGKRMPSYYHARLLDDLLNSPSVRPDEDEVSYYQRSSEQIKDIISVIESFMKRRPSSYGSSSTVNCLIVGHAPTAEVLTYDLLGQQPNINIVRQMASYVSFLCMVIAERTNGRWMLNNMPLIGTSVNNIRRPA